MKQLSIVFKRQARSRELKALGLSLKEIAARLNQEGYRTLLGKEVCTQTVGSDLYKKCGG